MPEVQPRTRGSELRVLLLSIPALLAPVAGAFLFPDRLADYEALLWLLALIPAFLLAYHRGWRGVATALALGMAVLSVTYVVAQTAGAEVPPLLLAVVVVYIGVTLGLGWLSEGVATRQLAEARATMALRDPLTDLPNRRHAEGFLELDFAAAQRGRPLAVVLFDIDHFQQFNVRNGRTAGDGVLRGIANVLRQHTRRMNLAARYGPDEFLCILAGTPEAGALTFATRIQERLRAAESTVALPTLSIGIAAWSARFQTPAALLQAAEDALLAAKQHGRDRIRIHGRGADELAALRAEVSPVQAWTDPLLVALSPAAPGRRMGEGQFALVVHGEREEREWLVGWLEEAGFSVRSTAAASAAVGLFQADCALAFVELVPGVAGGAADLVGELRRRAPGVRIVGMPPAGTRALDASVLGIRVDAHILPDITPEALRAELHALLEDRASELESLVLSRQVTDELRASARQARAAAAESEARYRGVVQAIQQVIFTTDRLGRWLSLNPAWTAISGYNVEESLGTVFWEYVHPEDREGLERAFLRLLESRGPYHLHEGRWRTRSGEYRWVETRLQVRFDGGGAVDGTSGVLTDVTDRRLAEEALRRNEEYFRSLIENSSDMIAVVDAGRVVRYVSPAVERLLGYRTDAWLEMSGESVVHPDDAARSSAMFGAALARPESTQVEELRIRHADGSWLTLEVSLRNQLSVPGVEGIVINARDVTERRRAEAALRESEELLARAQKMDAIGRLAGGVAHDFNNLLTAIQGHAALLLDELHDTSGIRTDLLEIRDAAERATTLTRQLLAFSRRQVLQPRVLDLNLVVADMEKMLRRMIGEHIELRTELGSPLDLVRADPAQLEQVLLNLAVNARDALPRGGHLWLRTGNRRVPDDGRGADPELPAGEYVMLQVEDDGEGMTAEVAEYAFEPFFTTKGPGSGTGLGLSTVYGIVKQSGGHVWLHSRPGAGTTVTLYLPRVAEPLELIEHAPALPVRPRGGSETVLLVEDESSVRDLARRVLERAGYRVLQARTGSEALELAAGHEAGIDLLLSDVVMPGMNGPELATRLAGLRPGTRVLFMSGYAEEAVAHHGAIAGTHAFMEKPFSPDELLRRVRAALDEPR